jgi:hypothetical protein
VSGGAFVVPLTPGFKPGASNVRAISRFNDFGDQSKAVENSSTITDAYATGLKPRC